MEIVSNIQLCAFFKECKSRFSSEPDFGQVTELLSRQMDVVLSEQLLADVKTEFKNYRSYQKKSQSKYSTEREIAGRT